MKPYIISGQTFGRIVDVLGSPLAVRLAYAKENYGPLQKDVHAALVEGPTHLANIRSLQVVVDSKNSDNPGTLSPEKLKVLYEKMMDNLSQETRPLSNPVHYAILTRRRKVLNLQEFYRSSEYNDSMPAGIFNHGVEAMMGFLGAKWEYKGKSLVVVVDPFSVKAFSRAKSEKTLRALENVVAESKVPYTRLPDRESHPDFMGRW